ncbi:F0F1 ATP synthase subunit B [Fulvivirgaceae bacterium BMA10]|uniref:ATP synthase subunit b n=1 Tax=Splendidivirga corallicola TaxID=3051826 RepID=A0ABT8KV84_9BACT|nr:F0F1 ATP synthase subunit B [Fulvivirgaceae bacterium BMA10]
MDLITPGFGLIFWQAVVFLIVVFILGKFAWKPILKSLKDREDSIDEALNEAKNAKEEMAQLKAENEKLLADARLERDQILKDATAAANKIREEAREEAGKISAKMVEDAKTTIQNEKKAALTEVKNQVAELSLLVAEKLIKKNLEEDKAQKALVDDFVKDLNVN